MLKEKYIQPWSQVKRYFSARNVSTQSSAGKCARSTSCSSQNQEPTVNKKESPSNLSMVAQQFEKQLNLETYEVPEGICDFDKENWDDIFQVSHYAMDIFNYLKSREVSNCITMQYIDILNIFFNSILYLTIKCYVFFESLGKRTKKNKFLMCKHALF